MPEVNWTDAKGRHNKVFPRQPQARAFFTRLPIETEGLTGASLMVAGVPVDRWYFYKGTLRLQSVSGPEPQTMVVKVEHESEHGTIVVPVRQYPGHLEPEQVRENLRQYPLPGVKPDDVNPLDLTDDGQP